MVAIADPAICRKCGQPGSPTPFLNDAGEVTRTVYQCPPPCSNAWSVKAEQSIELITVGEPAPEALAGVPVRNEPMVKRNRVVRNDTPEQRAAIMRASGETMLRELGVSETVITETQARTPTVLRDEAPANTEETRVTSIANQQIPIVIGTCGAHNRRGEPCRRQPVTGKSVCHYHGGAPGSGAPAGNQNARKHGFYSRTVPPELADRIDEALAKTPGVEHEIALLRALIDEAVNEGDDLETICKGLMVLRGLLSDQRWLKP